MISLNAAKSVPGLMFVLLAVVTAASAHGQMPNCDSGFCCDESPALDCDVCCQELSCRERWADSGITFSNNLTQFYFGTVDGGLEQTDRYGGHGDYVANFDLGKLGVQEGLFIKLRAEHRFGRSIVEPTGALLPATLAADLPVSDSRDLYLTNFVITQALSENFIVFAGKMDTLDGDANAFAHGRGITQFSNVAFVANPIALRTIPYASLGAGFAYLLEGEPLFSFLVINPTDTTTSSGFDELFADGVAMSAEIRVPTSLMGRLGHQLVGATYSTRDYVSLDQDPRIVLPQVPVSRSSDSWSLYWNMDQYLVTDRCTPGRGWGYFARAGIADDDTNPISSFLSAGIGGSSMIRGRESDSFGLGYFFYDSSEEIAPFLATVLGPIGDSQGVEAFYNIQATKTLTVTPDFQWLSQARQNIDDAYLLGVRANLAF
ncbi:Carbohydrate-selective porin, OprB family [Rubripirellula amarantea]|uniref:Carbohydrate-selective porin, OprB family n=1 Tax=Rubripirellula amarantea TaxID=2527999 RepID=A0A5C5WSA4_9BACT|nr:carbohydrate porin [Rubripirellula amarantea]TWT52973.1 Carbohydrate-selective porin, OprB family [Rubripirellula amarantea]